MQTAEHLFATPRHIEDASQCHFYHVMDIPGYGLTKTAQWDLRGNEDVYLGGLDLRGKRILEIGPASGYLTFYMESRGAEVVAVELSPDIDWDIVPDCRVDLEELTKDRCAGIDFTRNGFWFVHERVGSKAKVHYGNVYDIPDELGHFDVAVLCSVLLHLRDPLRVVQNCARLADSLVITEVHYPDFPNDRPMMQFFTLPDAPSPDLWWRFTPQLFVRFAEVMGYATNEVTFHEQTYVLEGKPRPATFFTVVSTDRRSGRA